MKLRHVTFHQLLHCSHDSSFCDMASFSEGGCEGSDVQGKRKLSTVVTSAGPETVSVRHTRAMRLRARL